MAGAAVTSIKIKNADHEFMSLPGVMEDVTDIVLNTKQLVVKSHADTPKTMRLHSEVKGVVTAELIEADPAIEIINPELEIATLTDDVKFDMKMVVQGGRGYVPGEQMYDPDADQELGRIYIDASYSPVTRVRYRTEDTRVGQRTNYDRLLMEIWTNGTITPEMALVEAAKIFRKHLNPFVQYFELGEQVVEAAPGEDHEEIDSELLRKLSMSVQELELGVRSNNCLEAGNIQTVGQLANCPETELLQIRSFGKTSLREVKRKLQDLGLSLGMNVPLPDVKGDVDEQATE
ncbi:MAG: DNA-directed RNA polymerase subunit alpha [Phycisphaerae bacterium]|nr:DNA-directed RNA polymerase subunit alpha [Phycisphaerae bacterium]